MNTFGDSSNIASLKLWAVKIFSKIDATFCVCVMIGKGKNLLGAKWDQRKSILEEPGFIDRCLEERNKK